MTLEYLEYDEDCAGCTRLLSLLRRATSELALRTIELAATRCRGCERSLVGTRAFNRDGRLYCDAHCWASYAQQQSADIGF